MAKTGLWRVDRGKKSLADRTFLVPIALEIDDGHSCKVKWERGEHCT